MQPRFVGRLSLADAVTVGNAALGFFAVVVAGTDPGLAARLVLLAGIADGLDGVVARHAGGSEAGPYLDSLADVASFAVAPAVIVVAVIGGSWSLSPTAPGLRTVAAYGLPALFVATAVTRLGLYTAHDTDDHYTAGVPSTLAATILAAAVLSGVSSPATLLAGTGVFCYLMVAPISYPDLLARDALLMGIVHALAVLFPRALGRTFPYALLTLSLAYLTLAPWLYWRDGLGRRPIGDVIDPDGETGGDGDAGGDGERRATRSDGRSDDRPDASPGNPTDGNVDDQPAGGRDDEGTRDGHTDRGEPERAGR